MSYVSIQKTEKVGCTTSSLNEWYKYIHEQAQKNKDKNNQQNAQSKN